MNEIPEKNAASADFFTDRTPGTTATGALCLVDTNGTVLTLNNAMSQLLGGMADEIVGTSIYHYFSSGQISTRFVLHMDEIVLKKMPVRFEERFRCRWFDHCILPLSDDTGTIKKIAVFSQDITMRKKYEEQLRANAEYLRDLVEHMSDLIIIIRSDGRLAASPSFERLTGYSMQEYVGHPIGDFMDPEDREQIQKVMAELYSVPAFMKQITIRLRTKAGKAVPLRGLISNNHHNESIEGIVFNGWETVQRII